MCGWSPITITPEMVGKKIPVFCSIELKTKNVTTTKEQKKAIAGVKRAGGIAGIVRQVEDFWQILEDWRGKFKRGVDK